MKKRLIEWNLPLAEISQKSKQESEDKSGRINSLHKWWARRPLAPSRATAFAALVNDPGDENQDRREYLTKLIESISSWKKVKDGNSKEVEEAQRIIRNQFGYNPKVLDPFSGGGSIPLEAIRLGCETFANDYNPIAVLIEKGTLEWPQKFNQTVNLLNLQTVVDAQLRSKISDNVELTQSPLMSDPNENVTILSYMVNRWVKILLEDVNKKIGDVYPIDHDGWIPVGYIWARTIECQNPNCRAEIPLIKSFRLSTNRKNSVAFKPIINSKEKIVSFILVDSKEDIQNSSFDFSSKTINKGNAQCLVCRQVTAAEDTRRLARLGQMGERLIAVVLHHPGITGKRYRIANAEDENVFSISSEKLKHLLQDWPYLESPIPTEEMAQNSRYMLPTNYGMKQWHELFNDRQKLALVSMIESIHGYLPDLCKECNTVISNFSLNLDGNELAKAILGYLGLFISKQVSFLCTLTRWKASSEQNIPVLSARAAMPMTWDYFETNPISGSCGTIVSGISHFNRLLDRLSKMDCPASISYTSALQLTNFPDNSLDAIFTDPPYYDNVPYAALADFFYVWLKRILGDVFPELFVTPLVAKKEEIVMEPDRHENDEKAKLFFENTLAAAFSEMYRILKPGGIAVIVYAYKTTDGWQAMLKGLVDAGLVVTSSWPIHSEMKSRLRASASAALASSIYMVCRKTEKKQLGFWNELQPQIKKSVEKKLDLFWSEGISGGDFFISSIGPGMEEYSKYQRVETFSGEQVGVNQLLDYIRRVSTDFLVSRLLKDASSESIDKEAQFYLTYRWTYLSNKVPFDDARKIANAEGIDITKLWDKGGFVKKSGSDIEVLGPKKRGEIKQIDNMVDAMHKACQLWEQGKKVEINRLLGATGYGQSNAFWQFCQAVAESLINGNKEKQLLEGLLVGKDIYIQESKEVLKELQKPRPEQTSLFDIANGSLDSE